MQFFAAVLVCQSILVLVLSGLLMTEPPRSAGLVLEQGGAAARAASGGIRFSAFLSDTAVQAGRRRLQASGDGGTVVRDAELSDQRDQVGYVRARLQDEANAVVSESRFMDVGGRGIFSGTVSGVVPGNYTFHLEAFAFGSTENGTDALYRMQTPQRVEVRAEQTTFVAMTLTQIKQYAPNITEQLSVTHIEISPVRWFHGDSVRVHFSTLGSGEWTLYALGANLDGSTLASEANGDGVLCRGGAGSSSEQAHHCELKTVGCGGTPALQQCRVRAVLATTSGLSPAKRVYVVIGHASDPLGSMQAAITLHSAPSFGTVSWSVEGSQAYTDLVLPNQTMQVTAQVRDQDGTSALSVHWSIEGEGCAGAWSQNTTTLPVEEVSSFEYRPMSNNMTLLTAGTQPGAPCVVRLTLTDNDPYSDSVHTNIFIRTFVVDEVALSTKVSDVTYTPEIGGELVLPSAGDGIAGRIRGDVVSVTGTFRTQLDLDSHMSVDCQVVDGGGVLREVQGLRSVQHNGHGASTLTCVFALDGPCGGGVHAGYTLPMRIRLVARASALSVVEKDIWARCPNSVGPLPLDEQHRWFTGDPGAPLEARIVSSPLGAYNGTTQAQVRLPAHVLPEFKSSSSYALSVLAEEAVGNHSMFVSMHPHGGVRYPFTSLPSSQHGARHGQVIVVNLMEHNAIRRVYLSTHHADEGAAGGSPVAVVQAHTRRSFVQHARSSVAFENATHVRVSSAIQGENMVHVAARALPVAASIPTTTCSGASGHSFATESLAPNMTYAVASVVLPRGALFIVCVAPDQHSPLFRTGYVSTV